MEKFGNNKRTASPWEHTTISRPHKIFRRNNDHYSSRVLRSAVVGLRIQTRDSLKNGSFKKPSFPIVDQVRAQAGIRGHVVVYESAAITAYQVLQNVADRLHSKIEIINMEEKTSNIRFQLKIRNEILAEEWYSSLTEAKIGLGELAIDSLRKTCFTIYRKVLPRESRKVDVLPPSSSSQNVSTEPVAQTSAPRVGGIGAKMMKQMGWQGGGLGAKEQGRTEIVQPYVQILRQGLGASANVFQAVTKILQDYATSKDINSIAFSPEFTKDERCIIHQVARKLHLRSRSYGTNTERLLVVQSKIRPWELVNSLLRSNCETEQLKLILPTNFVNTE